MEGWNIFSHLRQRFLRDPFQLLRVVRLHGAKTFWRTVLTGMSGKTSARLSSACILVGIDPLREIGDGFSHSAEERRSWLLGRGPWNLDPAILTAVAMELFDGSGGRGKGGRHSQGCGSFSRPSVSLLK